MKNVTISLPEQIYRQARIHAAEQDTSLSGYVRSLIEKATTETVRVEERRRALRDTLARIHQSQAERGEYFSAADNLSREEMYDRKKFR